MLIQSLDPGRAELLPKRVMVTAAPPTANGDLHLGHLSGPYLAADILTRHFRLQGVDTSFASGTDDNQSYVAFKARVQGIPPQRLADDHARDIEATLRAARIEP